MLIKVLMPALSGGMEAAKLSRWFVAPGAFVEPGDIMAEIETANATVELEAVDSGTIVDLLVAAGSDNVEIDTPIATIRAVGRAEGRAEGSSTGHATVDAESDAAYSNANPPRIKASPLARRLAVESGLSLAALTGSGPAGRIVERDVLAAKARRSMPVQVPRAPLTAVAALPRRTSRTLAMLPPEPLRAVASTPDAPATGHILRLYDPSSYELVPHDPQRRERDLRLVQAQREVPQLLLRVECRMDEINRARSRMNGGVSRSGQPLALELTDFLVKALSLALQQNPAANVTWTKDAMLRHYRSDIAVAVTTDTGTLMPVIREADRKSLSEISAELRDLADRACSGRLQHGECSGGTAAIANFGVHGVRDCDALVMPPHACMLAVGAVEQRPVVAEGRLEVAALMNCSLACDQRAIDAATGAELLAAFKALVEDPLRMLV